MTVDYITLGTAFLAFLTALAGLVKGLRNGASIQRIEVSVDGELTKLKELIAKSSHAEGVLEGKAEEKATRT